jgi:hypothetical protein
MFTKLKYEFLNNNKNNYRINSINLINYKNKNYNHKKKPFKKNLIKKIIDNKEYNLKFIFFILNIINVNNNNYLLLFYFLNYILNWIYNIYNNNNYYLECKIKYLNLTLNIFFNTYLLSKLFLKKYTNIFLYYTSFITIIINFVNYLKYTYQSFNLKQNYILYNFTNRNFDYYQYLVITIHLLSNNFTNNIISNILCFIKIFLMIKNIYNYTNSINE